ncbi:Outer membrane protein (porin) [Acinetobacter marinus]|uniref:Outer membrane protein (Porin) n=1 Tax=Acinetobacter marinus TaxID=281375 RepID=A0A1G6GP92_9GAMM|nr:porin [Acinetobacter marinus]SDB83683.1 Outer membrane protein (porin) [Acinetobacter marinus]
MKKLLLATAVATLSLSTVHAAPTLYGKLNVTLDQVSNADFSDDKVTELNSNASRIGIKGEEALTDTISAVYLAEWGVSTDGAGSDTDLSARNRFLGVKFANVGTVKAGKFDSYFKTAAGSAQDIFGDHTRLDFTDVLVGEDRLNNVIGFESDPKMLGGVQFNIMAQQGEGDEDDASNSRDGFGDSISTSVSYESDIGLALALAGNFDVQSKWAGLDSDKLYTDAYRLTGSYDFSKIGADGLVLGGLFQHAEPSDDLDGAESLEEQAFGITLAYSIPSTAWTVKGEYIAAETSADGWDDREIDRYGLGVDYKLNKQTKLYGVLAQTKINEALQVAYDRAEDKETVFGLGMEVKF